jgi:hypothetical protein
MEFPSGLFASEIPVDGGAVTVDTTAPGLDFAAQRSQVQNPALPQTLTAEQARFDFSLEAVS